MGIHEHASIFAGKRVEWYDPDAGATAPPGSCFFRLGGDLDYFDDQNFDLAEVLDRFLADPGVQPVVGLVVGAWAYELNRGAEFVVEALAAANERLPHLRGLFLGDIEEGEYPIHWIRQSDMTPLLDAYPRLEHFCVRGGMRLRFAKLRHANLKSLTVETGGLPSEPRRDIVGADLPALEHLELWLGSRNYGAPQNNFADLAPLFAGSPFPKLRHLGLRNAEDADALVRRLVGSAILRQIRVLDLSLGDLGDAGLDSLMADADVLRSVERLDLHHHYLTDAGVERASSLGIPVDVSDQIPTDDEHIRLIFSA